MIDSDGGQSVADNLTIHENEASGAHSGEESDAHEITDRSTTTKK